MAALPTSRNPSATVWWWMAGGWIGLVLLHLWMARGVSGPIVLQDESGYLGNARWLAGQIPVTEMGDQPVYAWGYSLVIAPAAALIDDPAVLYRAVQTINSVLLASLLPLLWVALRRIGGVAPGPAAIAAAAGSVFPATLVHSSVAWAESLLPVLVVLLALTTWLTLTDRPTWQRIMVAPVAVLAYAAHGRFLPVAGLALVALVASGVTRRLPRTVAIASGVLLVVGLVVVRVVNAALLDARWPDRVGGEGLEGDLIGRVLSPTNWPGIVGGSIGQGWYLVVTSLGLVAVGVVALVAWIGRRPAESPEKLTAAFVGVAILALFATSVVSFVGSAERVDHLIYGRYNEAFAPLLVATGAAALLATTAIRRRRLLVSSAAITVVLGAVLWVGRGPDAFTGDLVWNNVLGLRLAMEVAGQDRMVPMATVVALVVLGGLACAGRRLVPALVAAGGLLVAYAMVAVGPLSDFARVRYHGWEQPEQLGRVIDVAEVDAVGLDREGTGLMASLGYPFWSPDIAFRFTDTWSRPDPAGLVVAAIDAPAFDASGAAIVGLDARNGQATWVLPDTPAFDRLSEAGALLPPGFPSVFDMAARRALVTTSATAIEVDAGSSATIEIDVVHQGVGQAWPSDVEWPMPGVVRVGARWFDSADRQVQADDWAPLAGPMWPGDHQDVDLTLRAVDGSGEPLSPGRYRVEIALFQAELGWFPDALHLDVTVG